MEDSPMIWEVWSEGDQTYPTVKTKETKEDWDALMGEIAQGLFRRSYAPNKRTKTFHLCMAYAILTVKPYRYLRDFYGCEQFKGDKEALRQEVLRLQRDERYMEQWNDWIRHQWLYGTVPFDI